MAAASDNTKKAPLPRLPVPDLAASVQLHLQTAQGLLSATEQAEAEADAKAFLQTQGPCVTLLLLRPVFCSCSVLPLAI